MTNDQTEYSDTDYLALGYFLRREMYGVELNEEESCMATMSVLKFDFNRIEIPEVERKWGITSKDGWIAFPTHDDVWPFREGFVIVKHGKHRWSHINAKGELLADKWYDFVLDFEEGFAVVKQGGKYGYINTKGELLADKWYDKVWNFREGFAKVREGNKEGFIDKEGNFYDELP
jgi:hypothetical protein